MAIAQRLMANSRGSSPRAWGNARQWTVQRQGNRFIPTCVGKCQGRSPPVRMRPVHPHVRGEMRTAVWMFAAEFGSSPRAWGNEVPPAVLLVVVRFIPTCVGKCYKKAQEYEEKPVHPHVRGEMRVKMLEKRCKHGSSPRAWGNVANENWENERARFIPTCVGKCKLCSGRRQVRPVHPHVRGEM